MVKSVGHAKRSNTVESTSVSQCSAIIFSQDFSVDTHTLVVSHVHINYNNEVGNF